MFGIALAGIRNTVPVWLDQVALYGPIGALVGVGCCILSASRVNVRFNLRIKVPEDTELREESGVHILQVGIVGLAAVPLYLLMTWLVIRYGGKII